ncbi:MAG TPA: tRNA (adenosine(37)-N6)-threonylcarbamoyltransferase complex dimerization subunit type 1 TsaB [Desulfotomaculum sp.]|nr:tRNA (adenosine(37)-N6)-threonylcarbamoyltransferase complex dimerization subunit type 1 TsaB [Desulfotomaculum sp.]
MSYVLGIDTATAVLGVAVVGKDGLLAERSTLGERLHSVRLIPFIQDLLVEAGIALRDLTGIAVSIGPGSFTGLRLGLTAAKTLAQALDLPVVGVPTLLALAAPLLPGGIPVCPVLTSRRSEAYAAVYQQNGQGVKTAVMPFAAPPSGVSARLTPFRRVILAGEGAWTFRAELKEMLQGKAVFTPKIFSHPRGAVVADLGLKELAAGGGADPFSLVPEYLRPPAITGGTPCEG